MRVLFLLSDFLHYTSELANALARSGIDVTIVARDSGWDFVGSGSGDAKQDYRDILDPRIALEWVSFPKDTSPTTLHVNMACILRIISLVRKHRPDVLHLMDVADYRILAAVAISKLRCPMVLTVHDASIHPGDKTNKMEFTRPWVRRMSDAVIVHGEDIKERLLTNSSVPKEKIHRIVRGPYLMYRRWMTGVDGDDSGNVLFFGRVSKYKGLDYLIKAAPTICRVVPEARFVIAGSGPDWDRCKSLIENPVHFVLREEKITETEVTRLFEEASVVVLPYIEASQSGVLAIAFALKKPVIITNVGSLPEVVDNEETGLIVPPADVDSLANAIIRLLTHPDLRRKLAERAHDRAMNGDLSWDSVAEKTGELYQSIYKKRLKGR